MQRESMTKIADQIRHQLLTIDTPDDVNMYIDTPVMYPNGTSVVVHIRSDGGVYFVSDMSMGCFETDLACDDIKMFEKTAQRVAREVNAKYIDQAICFTDVDREQLAGAVMHIANSSQRAVRESMFQITNHQTKKYSDELFNKIKELYPTENVTQDMSYIGSSTRKWNFDVGLKKANGSEKIAVCDIVHKSANSVNSSVAKFYDVKQLKTPPARFAMINHSEKFKNDQINLLTSLSSVWLDDITPEKMKNSLDRALC